MGAGVTFSLAPGAGMRTLASLLAAGPFGCGVCWEMREFSGV